LEEGRPDSGLELVQEALALAEKRGLRSFLPEFVRLKGELLLQRGDVAVGAAAEACFAQALEGARPPRARTWELRAAMSMARLWQRRGRREDARALLAGVYEWFTEGFDTPDLRDARALLAELSGAVGETRPYPAHSTG
jgi:predicted ATPase